MSMRKASIILGALLLSIGLHTSVYSQAQYPKSPVTLVIPFGPGGAADVSFRALIQDLRTLLKVPINVSNRPGAGGIVGTDFVAFAKPDGYNLLGGTSAIFTVAPAIDPKTLRDLDHIATVVSQGVVLVVRTENEIRTLEDLIRRGKEKPGDMTIGTAGVQTPPYFDLAFLELATGAKFSHVPIADSNEGMANMLGGHIDAWFGTVSATQNMIRAGRARALATCTPKRLADFPDVPTFAEKGFPDVSINITMMLSGPKGLPADVIKTWEDALKVVLAKPEIVSALGKLNYEVDFQAGPARINQLLNKERETMKTVVKDKGIKP
jgi:tripartite-type tricarboxylate transporter receptor subunit TctC